MCIICIKPAGVTPPTEETIKNMWDANSDGAGIMYTTLAGAKNVTIEKGFMHLKDLKRRLNQLGNLKDRAIVYHFRITTHGGTKPENCHPFPISSRRSVLEKTRIATDVGMAHNGMINITPRTGISDTMEYDLSQLSHMKRIDKSFYLKKDWLKLIEDAIDSKMAFLDGDGRYTTIGSFEEHDGCFYSNGSYKDYVCKGRYSRLGSSYTSEAWDEYDLVDKLMRLNDWSATNDKAFKIIDKSDKKIIFKDDYDEFEFAINNSGVVFYYDPTEDAFVWVAMAEAVDDRGQKIKYDKDLSTYEYISYN